ncbi:MAG: ATP-dependent 6-phosphofructokinase [Desulfobulbaceae bacterium]|nr:ATP-dependent 6-phosphofructokinase [Desulfobulbaceae bacterium]
MTIANTPDLNVRRLGECRFASPVNGIDFVADDERILYESDPREIMAAAQGAELCSFEAAGPRKRVYFNAPELCCGIVTCGGLSPGINDVIRAIVMSLNYHYGVKTLLGFRYGFAGLNPQTALEPMALSPEKVDDIHLKGGTILGTSRGPQDIGVMVNTLEEKNIGILFAIGGDGTMRGAHAISEEIERRGLKTAVVGIPKTIDNDLAFVQQSFGFETAVTETRKAIYAAHMEAHGARNGIGLVKLMGRYSGFIAAYATLASSDVNFCLVPEIKFSMDGFLEALRERLIRKDHAVIVTAEGAGQELMQATGEHDASGNIRLGDIGAFLRQAIKEHFSKNGMEYTLKYIDPSYMIRSVPSNAHDSVYCLLLGHNAVHAAMSGRTDMLVGNWKDRFTHLPLSVAVSTRKKIEPGSRLWNNVLEATGQPSKM